MQEKPIYPNLAHQFLDDNFLTNITSTSMGKLPLLSSNIRENLQNEMDAPRVVDFFSHEFETEEEIYNCWKSVNNNNFMRPYELSNIFSLRSLNQVNIVVNKVEDLMLLLPCTSSIRLENASWRAWFKKKNGLKEIHPKSINWFKENDVTVLYGPIIETRKSSFGQINNKEVTNAKNNSTVDPSAIELFSEDTQMESDCDESELHKIINSSIKLERSNSNESISTVSSLDCDMNSNFSISTASSSTFSSNSSSRSKKYKSILKKPTRKRFGSFDHHINGGLDSNNASLYKKRNSVSFNVEVEKREIIGDHVFDHTYLIY